MGKKLGQHFLKNDSIAKRIVQSANLSNESVVLEIGPGTGKLTKTLLSAGAKVVALEKDVLLISELSTKFQNYIKNGQLSIVAGDVRSFSIATEFQKGSAYSVIANIPYYITGAIIKKFLSHTHQPEEMVLMVQKEVAQRIVAKDGKESILSISIKAYGDPEYLFTVKSGSFVPPPAVDSAVLAIRNISKNRFSDVSETVFFQLVKAGFAHKRKVLRANVGITPNILSVCGLDENVRAETLSCENWFCIARQKDGLH